MLAWIAFASLVSSPYPFEVSRGLAMEPVIGSTFSDKLDAASLSGGLRLSYFRPDETDAFFTPEVQFLSQTVLTGKQATPLQKWTGDLSLALYEIYNPYVFRLAGGGGAEYRESSYSFLAYYRGGLGRFFNSDVGFFIDFGQRQIFRKSKRSFPMELTTSLIWIF
jgi:hypothetical protein